MIAKSGIVIKSTGSWYSVRSTEGNEVLCRIKGKLRIKGIRSTNPISVGDLVFIDIDPTNDNWGIIKAVAERKNYIIRKSINLSKESHIIAANVDQAILVATMNKPVTTTVFIDRFLASAEAYNIPTILVFNKIDILDSKAQIELETLLKTYEVVGYQCVITSTLNMIGIDHLKELIKDKINVIAGHSGAGKSSIINALDPTLNQKTGEISDYHQQGKHITTFSEMLPFSFGGYVIDTPGIRGFGLIDLQKKEISHFFREIFLAGSDCKYYNCTHTCEPECNVVREVQAGKIALSRYLSYLNILENDDNRYRSS